MVYQKRTTSLKGNFRAVSDPELSQGESFELRIGGVLIKLWHL